MKGNESCSNEKLTVGIMQYAGAWPVHHKPLNRGNLYIQIKYGKNQQRTSFWPQDLPGIPTWKESFIFSVKPDCDSFEVNILEKFVFTTRFLGKVVIHLSNIKQINQMFTDGYHLMGKKGVRDSKYNGYLGISMKLSRKTEISQSSKTLSEIHPSSMASRENSKRSRKSKRIESPADFNLSNILALCKCEQYLNKLIDHGFDDPGSFSNISEEVLIQELFIHCESHRKCILKAASIQRDLAAQHEKNKEFTFESKSRMLSIDGKTMFSSLRQLNESFQKPKVVTKSLSSSVVADNRSICTTEDEIHDNDLRMEMFNFHSEAIAKRVSNGLLKIVNLDSEDAE